MSSTSAILVTNPSFLASFNRGPITAVFSPPASCQEILTLSQGNRRDLYWGHLGRSFYYDPACYPVPTVPAQDLVNGPWDTYYCEATTGFALAHSSSNFFCRQPRDMPTRLVKSNEVYRFDLPWAIQRHANLYWPRDHNSTMLPVVRFALARICGLWELTALQRVHI